MYNRVQEGIDTLVRIVQYFCKEDISMPNRSTKHPGKMCCRNYNCCILPTELALWLTEIPGRYCSSLNLQPLAKVSERLKFLLGKYITPSSWKCGFATELALPARIVL